MVTKNLANSYLDQLTKFSVLDKQLTNKSTYDNGVLEKQAWKVGDKKKLLECYSDKGFLNRRFYVFDEEHNLDVILSDEGHLSEVVYQKYDNYLHLEFDEKGNFLNASKANLNDETYTSIKSSS